MSTITNTAQIYASQTHARELLHMCAISLFVNVQLNEQNIYVLGDEVPLSEIALDPQLAEIKTNLQCLKYMDSLVACLNSNVDTYIQHTTAKDFQHMYYDLSPKTEIKVLTTLLRKLTRAVLTQNFQSLDADIEMLCNFKNKLIYGYSCSPDECLSLISCIIIYLSFKVLLAV